MLWIVESTRRSVIVAARSAEAARGAVWQARAPKFASDDEIREHGDVIIIADVLSDEEEDRLERTRSIPRL